MVMFGKPAFMGFPDVSDVSVVSDVSHVADVSDVSVVSHVTGTAGEPPGRPQGSQPLVRSAPALTMTTKGLPTVSVSVVSVVLL